MNFNGPLANDALRQALLMALDHETMCNVTVAGMYTPGFAALPSSLAYNYDQLTNPYPYDVEKAKETLDEAGIVDTDGDGIRELDGENINLVYLAYTSRNLNDFAQAIALQLEEIGIGVTLNVSDYDTITALQNAGEFDLVTANTTTVGTGDPQDFLSYWYSGNSGSYGYYHNEEYDACFEELSALTAGIPEEERHSALPAAATFRGAHGIEGIRVNDPVMDSVNAVNPADEGAGEAKDSYTVDKEQILAWNPEYIFLDSGGAALVRQDYAERADFYASLDAVRNGRLYQYPSSTSYYDNMEISLANCYFVGSTLYPEAFAGVDFEAKAGEIFAFFLGEEDYLDVLGEYGAWYGPVELGE